ncbi:MAG: argininosuccinate synthase, partial [Ktedonobacterales bacterium]
SREQVRLKEQFAGEYARLIYNGLWYTAVHADLMAFVRSSQRFVSGEVRLKLSHGTCAVVGRRSQHSLYQHALATYETGDAFDHRSALGFIALWGLPVKTQAEIQLLSGQQGDGFGIPDMLAAPDTIADVHADKAAETTGTSVAAPEGAEVAG